jgi:hypothetical protein
VSTELKALLDLVDALKRQHRAGIAPSFGQVDELFDLAASVRAEAQALPSGSPATATTPDAAVVALVARAARRKAELMRAAQTAEVTLTIDHFADDLEKGVWMAWLGSTPAGLVGQAAGGK